MTTLGFLYLLLKFVATLLSLWFSLRKLYRWRRTKKKQANTHRPKG